MILRGKLTLRRKALLVIVVLLLAAVTYAYYAGMAITTGMQTKDMDWNRDGTVTRTEIAQSIYAVSVIRTQEGNRHCSEYRWRSSGEAIRVDCRTVFQTPEKQ